VQKYSFDFLCVAILGNVDENLRWRRWGSLLPCLRTRDTSLSPPSTSAEIFLRTCMHSHLQTSPPIPKKAYAKFQTPKSTSGRKGTTAEEEERRIMPLIVATTFAQQPSATHQGSARTPLGPISRPHFG
jgi:hypothetical protein